jgi:hypothetical protein
MSLLDTASLIVTPNGYKTSKLYSIVPSDGTGDMTFSRTGNTATRVNSSGVIETVNANIPRLDYTDSTCPKLLLEPQRTNLLTYSNGLDNADWVKSAITVTASAGTSPDGTNNAFLVDATTNQGNIKEIKTVTASTAYVFSFYAKRGTATNHKYSIYNQTAGSDIIAPTSYYSQTNSSTWVRITVAFTTPSGCTSVAVYTHRDSLATGTTLVYGAQLEASSIATSYIPTTTASVTRNSENYNKTSVSALLNNTQGTIFYQGTGLNVFGNERCIFEISDGTNDNFYKLVYRNFGAEFQAQKTGIGNIGVFQSLSTNVNHKIVAVYSSSIIKLYVDGSLSATLTNTANTITGLNQINFGRTWQSLTYLEAKVNSLLYWKTALTDSECISLTTL